MRGISRHEPFSLCSHDKDLGLLSMLASAIARDESRRRIKSKQNAVSRNRNGKGEKSNRSVRKGKKQNNSQGSLQAGYWKQKRRKPGSLASKQKARTLREDIIGCALRAAKAYVHRPKV